MVGDHAIEFRNGNRHGDISLAPRHAWFRGPDLWLKGYSARRERTIPEDLKMLIRPYLMA